MNYLYLLINICTISVPLVFSFHPKLQFNKHFKSFFFANFTIALLFILWDSYFTKIGVWGFNSRYILEVNLLGLPLEEILFFICIPFACVFTYHCFGLVNFFNTPLKFERELTAIFSISFLILGLIFLEKAYTASTFISLAIVLFILKFILDERWLSKIIKSYIILLIPFFIVNGILTGSGLEEPIVWYNNDENLGIRLLTIPIEDTFYGFLLIILNVFVYEKLKLKFK